MLLLRSTQTLPCSSCAAVSDHELHHVHRHVLPLSHGPHDRDGSVGQSGGTAPVRPNFPVVLPLLFCGGYQCERAIFGAVTFPDYLASISCVSPKTSPYGTDIITALRPSKTCGHAEEKASERVESQEEPERSTRAPVCEGRQRTTAALPSAAHFSPCFSDTLLVSGSTVVCDGVVGSLGSVYSDFAGPDDIALPVDVQTASATAARRRRRNGRRSNMVCCASAAVWRGTGGTHPALPAMTAPIAAAVAHVGAVASGRQCSGAELG